MFAITGPNGFSKVLGEDQSLVLGRGHNGIDDQRCSRAQVLLKVEGGQLMLTVTGANPSHVGVELLCSFLVSLFCSLKQTRNVSVADGPVPVASGESFALMATPRLYVYKAERQQDKPSNKRARLPDCPFGLKCYRSNPAHFEEYGHPWKDKEADAAVAFAAPAPKKEKTEAPKMDPAKTAPVKDVPVAAVAKPAAKQQSQQPSQEAGSPGKDDSGQTVISFGKHKGRTFAEVFEKERSYVRWCLEQEASAALLPLQSYCREREEGVSATRPSATDQQAALSPAAEKVKAAAMADEWRSTFDVAGPAAGRRVDLQAEAAPAKPGFGQAAPRSMASLTQGPPLATGGGGGAAPVAGLAAVMALPLLGVNATLQVPPDLGVAVCAEAASDFLEAHPDDDLLLVVVEPDAGRRTALTQRVRDKCRFAARAASDVAAFCAVAAEGREGPGFAMVEMTWRMQPVPKSGGHSMAALVAGRSSALHDLAKEALREAGLEGADVGRSYVVGPFDPHAVLTAGGRAAAPRLRFFVACVAPNANPAKANAVEERDQVAALLRSAYDSAFDSFLRAYNRYCE